VNASSPTALRSANFLSDKSDNFVGLIWGYDHPSKDASPPTYQNVLSKRLVRQVQSWVNKQRAKRNRANVRNICKRRPPDSQGSEHYELDSIITQPVFATTRAQELACSKNNGRQDQSCNHNGYYGHFEGRLRALDPGQLYGLLVASALTQIEDTGIGASFSKIALAEVVHVKGRQWLLWAWM
jgi:hypothetical protein